MTISHDFFGFLPVNRLIEWNSGRAIPISGLGEIISEIQEEVNEDGFIYPPVTETYTTNLIDRDGKSIPIEKARWTPKPDTKRPALLHKLPVSHKIEIDKFDDCESFRDKDGGFLLHFIGYLFGYRLQFIDWWHDGRIYMKGRRWAKLKHGVEFDFISRAYETWSGWNISEQTRFTNILYMHCRSDTYEWDWERFNINYMVFDACYKMTKEIKGLSYCRHSDRFGVLFENYGLQEKEGEVQQIVSLRNDLLHETRWDGGQPCSSEHNGYRQADNLKRISDRLILAIVGCNTAFIHSPWWSIGQHILS